MAYSNTDSQLSSLPQAAAPRVSVVIVVWNAKKYVLECLDSLHNHSGQACSEIIVVDNASTDGTPELIERLYPEIKLIRNAENLGFAKANNIGIAASSGDYICLVNSDVKFISDSISALLQYLGQNPRIAMVGPKMLTPDGEVARSTMRFPTLWNYFCRALGLDIVFKRSRAFGGFLMSDFDHQSTAAVEVLNGWFLLVRRSAIDRVGVLDPQFFMYGEDVDWCYRFRQAGERVVFLAGAEAIHYGGASSSNAPLRFYLEMCRADWQLWRKHRAGPARAAFLILFAVHHSARLFCSAGSYLCWPSERPRTLLKLRRNLAGLKWLSQSRNLRQSFN